MAEVARDKLKKVEEKLDEAIETGSKSVERYEAEVKAARKALRKAETEEKIPKPHPALQFGPLSQTIIIMAAITMAMSVTTLPYDMLPFYYLFSRITIVAVVSLITHSSIVWYGYTKALGAVPKEKPKDAIEALIAKLTKPPRPDIWANPRSHPSQFLTTRHAPPRIFPFPLGKTRPDATVKDELWWEGGNAPHVGHFNRPALAKPGDQEAKAKKEDIIIEKVERQMAADSRQAMWKKRIRGIQLLCLIVMVNFLNQKIAIAALAWLIYNTLSTEIEAMLQPPKDNEKIYDKISKLAKADRVESHKGPDMSGDPPLYGGMAYIYNPAEPGLSNPTPAANIPTGFTPAPVLLTSENGYYAGSGQDIMPEG